MADEEKSGSKKITVTVKTPKDKHVVEVEEDASIKDVSCPFLRLFRPLEQTFDVNRGKIPEIWLHQ